MASCRDENRLKAWEVGPTSCLFLIVLLVINSPLRKLNSPFGMCMTSRATARLHICFCFHLNCFSSYGFSSGKKWPVSCWWVKVDAHNCKLYLNIRLSTVCVVHKWWCWTITCYKKRFILNFYFWNMEEEVFNVGKCLENSKCFSFLVIVFFKMDFYIQALIYDLWLLNLQIFIWQSFQKTMYKFYLFLLPATCLLESKWSVVIKCL